MGKSWKNPLKQANAAKKGLLFTKLAREIQVAAKVGGPDPNANARLRMAIDAAKAKSCPNDTIERAIKKGAGLLEDGNQIEEVTYEGYGPHGVGVIVECQTDNRHRTAPEIRNAFKKAGGNLGESGSVMWMFPRVGLIEATREGNFDPEEEAIEVNANEVEPADEGYAFVCALEELEAVRTALARRGWKITTAGPGYRANNYTELSEEQLKEVHEFLQTLDDMDDTHRVYATVR
ncbi:MAG: YebC/PmpR family DNA-binding transcriptional regulator [Bdellovibrionaceae bacterium]|nr:YebC/PmpR family DNA-binding transcriptional regulator [Pseudobdellovibrionaceae bacterium]